MTYRRLRLRLSISSGICFGAGVTTLAVALLAPLKRSEEDFAIAKPRSETRNPPSESNTADWTETRFGELLNRTLQRPVIDQPSTEKDLTDNRQPTPPPQPPQIQLELIGTAIESDPQVSHAWIRVNGQSERLVKKGDILEGLQPSTQVKSIESKRIVVTAGGFDLEFKFN